MTAMSYGRPGSANRYLGDSLATASPASLLVMLYDRLVLDLKRAEEAQRTGDRQTAHVNLIHAQDIIAELHSSLKVDLWDGGPGLASLYTWLLGDLAQANMKGDPTRTADTRTRVVEPLADAWRQAALQHLTATTNSGANGLA
ncbi:flagellar export chaperone FliS [Kineococcus sp. R8]|uniref:flagellar export chaperone FliS n=1 Tax=Kineococcus siccus TaxID=2696567 RepID=UPI001411F37D|nr:flagellar export chaperone FliS [Kineococcus siccus]NAZ81467.1 flagellar export chaperone FliS [Kineococcus siccus]